MSRAALRFAFLATVLAAAPARAQDAAAEALARETSGTAWEPAAARPHAHGVSTARGWDLLWHGEVVLHRVEEGGDRGSGEWGSTNWAMGAASRPWAGGALRLRGMASLEPWTVPGCGTPNLLQTGETCDGSAIVDAQHPHDLFMEASATWARPLGGGVVEVYAALVGEPALGPPAFVHRASAALDPVAPIAHHWLDASHVSFGVVTASAGGRRWKLEASAFNGRDPDDERADLDLAPLASVAGRVQLAPLDRLALQASVGWLSEAHRHVTLLPPELECPALVPAHGPGCHGIDPAAKRLDVVRATGSAAWAEPLSGGRLWATTLAWGRNAEEGHADTDAWLLESRLDVTAADVVFGRVERVEKSDHDLALRPSLPQYLAGIERVFVLEKATLGYARRLGAVSGFAPAIGAAASAARVPEALEPAYGERTTWGATLYLTLRRDGA